MSETARVLRFPRRWHHPLSPEDVAASARSFLETESEERAEEETDRCLSDPDVLSSVCKLLSDAVNSNPKLVSARASAVYRWIGSRKTDLGLFDERDYFLGETARLTATALRHLGHWEETEAWLQRAEAGFRHTLNPGPLLAQLAYLRLSLAYDRRRYAEVLELLPSLLKSFEKFQMPTEAAKTRFLEAMTLKEGSRMTEAFEKFKALRDALDETRDIGLLGQVHVEIGACHAFESQDEEAIRSYQKALVFLSRAGRAYAVADVKMDVGEMLRRKGDLSGAAEAFREGVQLHVELGMATYVAYGRVILAETLIALGRHREAEWEIIAALPTIEEQKMVPEGFAAVTLLRESVRRRQADPNALRELREHLKANG